MATAISAPESHSVGSPDVLRRVNALRKTDNFTNWYYFALEYLFLGSVVGLTLAFYHFRPEWGLSWLWSVPVTLLAIVLVGAGQHRLTTLAHEASHYMLFRNRRLNELAADFLCMFPVWSTTHHYRLQHLAHHQYPNDPERDPDVAQMEASGHRFRFPMSPGKFVWECVVKQLLWFPSLIRYARIRARFSSTGGGSGPYGGRSPARYLIAVGILYLLSLTGMLTGLVLWGDPLLLAVVPPVMLAAVLTFYAVVPEKDYLQTVVKCDVAPRWRTFFRVSYWTAAFTALAWLTHLTGEWWALYYVLLWLVPLGTTFAFFMILRQVVQHGNASQDRFTNTRIFLVGPLIRWAVFPLGMHYHLPHHLFPLVPHYRLRQLHELLLETEEYRNQATVVEGYFFHRRPPEHPTVLELMATDITK
jgi:fatty acid desaturase